MGMLSFARRHQLLGMMLEEVEQRLELWILNRVGQANDMAMPLVFEAERVLAIIGRSVMQLG